MDFGHQCFGEVTALPVSGLERAENLEQLRWLENGYPIMTRVVADSSIGIDTPSDLEKAEKNAQIDLYISLEITNFW